MDLEESSRRTAGETQTQLIEAVVRLLKKRHVDRISVRDIAAEAGVNHGFVHRYFGSKAQLVRAAVQRISTDIHQGATGHAGMSAVSYAYLRAHPELAHVVARACLDGPSDLVELAAPPRERLEEIIAPIRTVLERLDVADGVDPYVLNALAASMLLGWFAFKPMLEHGFGLPEDADDQVAGLLELLDLMVAGPQSTDG